MLHGRHCNALGPALKTYAVRYMWVSDFTWTIVSKAFIYCEKCPRKTVTVLKGKISCFTILSVMYE
jgi:hypothetical protein